MLETFTMKKETVLLLILVLALVSRMYAQVTTTPAPTQRKGQYHYIFALQRYCVKRHQLINKRDQGFTGQGFCFMPGSFKFSTILSFLYSDNPSINH